MDLANLGSVLFLRGDLAESGRVLAQALEICNRIDFKQACGVALTSQGDLLSGEGKLDQASTKYSEALKIRNEMGAQLDAAETQVSIADLAIETGHSKDAEAAMRQAREVFRTQKLIEDEIWADSVLARALLAQRKATEAQEELDSAALRAEKIQNEEVQLKLALAAASVHAASGKPSDQASASNRLEAVLAQANKHDFVRYQFEARLALGQIEMKSGTNGRARLAQLEKDARAKGFLLIARKAAAAAKG
jgi:tetratricopeptide (TPR) repeat protein